MIRLFWSLGLGVVLVVGGIAGPVLGQGDTTPLEDEEPLIEPRVPDEDLDLDQPTESPEDEEPDTDQDSVDTGSLEEPPEEVLEGQEEPGDAYLDRVLAVVQDDVVTLGDYRAAYGNQPLEADRLRRLIEDTLVTAGFRQYGITQQQDQLEQYVNQQIRRQKQNPRQFNALLDRRGLTEEEYRQQILRDIQRNQLLQRVYLEDPEAARLGAAVRTRGRMMFLPDEETAREVYELLEELPELKTWRRLYDQYAQPRPFLDEEGRLEEFTWGTWDREIEYRFFSLPVLGVSEPFSWRNNHVILFRSGVQIPPVEEVTDEAMMRYYDQYRSRYLGERLPDRLAEEFTIHVPESVEKFLDGEIY